MGAGVTLLALSIQSEEASVTPERAGAVGVEEVGRLTRSAVGEGARALGAVRGRVAWLTEAIQAEEARVTRLCTGIISEEVGCCAGGAVGGRVAAFLAVGRR